MRDKLFICEHAFMRFRERTKADLRFHEIVDLICGQLEDQLPIGEQPYKPFGKVYIFKIVVNHTPYYVPVIPNQTGFKKVFTVPTVLEGTPKTMRTFCSFGWTWEKYEERVKEFYSLKDK